MNTWDCLSERQLWWIRFGIVLITVAVYARIAGNEFISLDDGQYIYINPEIQSKFTFDSIRYAFSLTDTPGYWHPVTMLSLMLDYRFFGLNPAGYHIENLLLHSVNSLLLFEILFRSTRLCWPSAFVAALFALHPLNVETVSWAVERKTVLSALFFLLTLAAYLRYVARPALGRYLLVTLLFALGLMTKSSLVSVPVLMLILDVWPLQRSFIPAEGMTVASDWRRIILEKVPLCILSVLSVEMSLASFGSSLAGMDDFGAPLATRFANTLISYATYPLKLIWPSKLAVYYPLLTTHSTSLAIICGAILCAVSAFSALNIRRRPWLFAGWFWYAIALLPVSGLIRKGLWPEMADRFTYLPAIGIFIVAAWTLRELLPSLSSAGRKIVVAACCSALALYAATTYIQAGKWRNSETLYRHSVAVTENNHVILTYLGMLYCDRQEYPQAFEVLKRAAAVNPRTESFLKLCRGQYEMDHGNYDAAERIMTSVSRPEENSSFLYFTALFLLANNEERAGKLDMAVMNYNRIALSPLPEAKAHKQKAEQRLQSLMPVVAPRLDQLRRQASSAAATPEQIGRLALELDKLGLYDEALHWYKKLDADGAGNWQLWFNMGNALKKLQRLDEAAGFYLRVVGARPDFKDAYNNLGTVYKNRKRYASALEAFDNALKCDPEFGFAWFNRAATLVAMKERDKARLAFTEIMRRFPDLSEQARHELAIINMGDETANR